MREELGKRPDAWADLQGIMLTNSSSELISSSASEPDEAGLQLQHELHAQADRSLNISSSRPSLWHLNADSSWLLSLPYPRHVSRPIGRCRFNIVIDAWLTGSQIDGYSWFSAQEHAHPSSIQSLSELNLLLQTAETELVGGKGLADTEISYIDAVVCAHEFTDHCHEATLRTLPPTVPVFAPKKAASLIRSWKHFANIIEIPVYFDSFHWRKNGVDTALLPPWISFGRVHTKGDMPIHFHSALMITFALDEIRNAETIIYTPHGILAASLTILKTATPPVSVLALIHGLHDVSLVGAQLNLGKENAIKARELTSAKYWLPTHDEVKIAHGIVATFLKRIAHTSILAPGSHPLVPDKQDITVREQTFIDVKNGQSIVLN